MTWRHGGAPPPGARGAPQGPDRDDWPDWKLVAELSRSASTETLLLTAPDGRRYVRKRYRFPTLACRLRPALRHTGLPPARVAAEARALREFARRGLPAVRPVAWAVDRDRFGLVRDSWLLTEAEDAPDLAVLLARGEPPSLTAVAAARSILALHEAGVFHGGLAPRNLLVVRRDDERAPRCVWLDPAKTRFFQGPVPPPLRAAEAVRFAVACGPDRSAFAAAVLDRIGAGLSRAERAAFTATCSRLESRPPRWLVRERARAGATAGPASPAPRPGPATPR